jgi:hypothetical protein
MLVLSACRSGAGKNVELRFGNDGKFKIAQFTDLHLTSGSPNCAVTEATVRRILELEKPDIAILTGDVVCERPSRELWAPLAEIFEKARTPFAVVFGNHDAETGVTREEVFDILERSPWFVGEKGPEGIFGCGNYVLPLLGSRSGKAQALLYCLDSNDYNADKTVGGYDRIHFDQIDWYRRQSTSFTADNGGVPLPGLMFFHIPLQEYAMLDGQKTTVGAKGEGVAGSRINSGMFASILDMGDVQGVFVGHDHDNDYIGLHCGVALAFGRVTGADAYGKPARGARIIELDEDQPRRFTTWIRTPEAVERLYYYPSGITKDEEDTASYLPAIEAVPEKHGVRYAYCEGMFKTTEAMAAAPVLEEGTLANFSIEGAPAEDHFGFTFRAWINVPERGIYYFYTLSDDGSRLYIDGELTVDNDGSHSSRRAIGKAALEAGLHELRLLYFEDYMGQQLEVGWRSREFSECTIPDDVLYLPE